MRRRAPIAAGVLILASCVTERPKPGLHYRSPPVGGQGEASRAPRGSGPAFPSGLVAAPVLDSTFTSSVRYEVVPLGGVQYDGQVLPLVSPDGRLLASETGHAPGWPTLLAEPGASVPTSTRITVFDISKAPSRTVQPAAEPPPGLLLGRAADDAGFLVEAPQPDGSRWIGRMAWVTGSLEWLVRDGRVNAHAVLTPGGSLAYASRAVESDEWSLRIRASDGTGSASMAGGSHLFPVASPEPGIVCTVSRTGAGLEMLAWSLDQGPESGGPERLGGIAARALVCRGGDGALAYQIVAPASRALPRRAGEPWDGARPAIFHPSFGRMAEFNRAIGGLVLLPEHSIAAARTPGSGAQGWFVTTPEGLMFSSDAARATEPGRRRTVQDVRVIAGQYVPRATTDPDRPLVLLGPSSRDRNRLEVMALRFGPGEERRTAQ